MRRIAATLLTALTLPVAAADGAAGLTAVQSSHDVFQTADRLVSTLEGKGLKIFSRIDHAGAAEKAGLELRPTQLVLFGDPKLGTTLMHCGQTVAIDLPLKALVWEDAEGNVWLGYNTPDYLAERHGLEGCEKQLQKVTEALEKFAKTATE
jgi:uncharacterized protein (DUF302 family)